MHGSVVAYFSWFAFPLFKTLSMLLKSANKQCESVDACDCTLRLYGRHKRVFTASRLWEKTPLPHRGLEPWSAAPHAQPTELHPPPLPSPSLPFPPLPLKTKLLTYTTFRNTTFEVQKSTQFYTVQCKRNVILISSTVQHNTMRKKHQEPKQCKTAVLTLQVGFVCWHCWP